MNKWAAIIIGTAAIIPNVYAADDNAKAESAIGFSLGWVEANGLSYRRYFEDSYMQFTFAGAYDKAAKEEYFDASVSAAHYLSRIESNNFFPLGLKFVYGLELERDTDRKNDLVDVNYTQVANEMHVGAGLGLDVGRPRQRGLGLSLNAMYTASFRDYKKMEFVRLGLLPSASIYYNF